MKKKKRSETPRLRSRKQPRSLQLVEYEITSEPIPDSRYERLPRHVQDTIERLHGMLEDRPAEAIPELRELIKQYPDLPILYNILCAAYQAADQLEQAEIVILENYRRNPHYLFARINYADLCLQNNDYEKLAEIFDHKFDLKLQYPERTKFHVSEVTHFMGVVGTYFYRIGKLEAAASCLDVLRTIAPDNSRTELLGMLLGPGLIKQWLRRIKESLNTGP